MDTREQIVKQKQSIARCENSLVLEKLKKRRAETRRKIELGGLVVKAGMDGFNKSVILGALVYASELLKQDETSLDRFEGRGNKLFLGI